MSVPTLTERLEASRARYGSTPQLRPLAHSFAQRLLGTLFPQLRHDDRAPVEHDLEHLRALLEQLTSGVATLEQRAPKSVCAPFFERLGEVHALLEADADAIFTGDPAAKSVDEVVLTYPGFLAIAVFRVAHLLHGLGLPLVPRLLTEFAHEKTGIDIHPGATIGKRFCIDHGTGIVIGETTHIGDGVKVYQGVTLGALTVEKALADTKRHPTIEDDVIIYAGATILGGRTVVGKRSIIAGNAWLTHSVPANSVVSRTSEVKPRSTETSAFEAFDFVI